MKNADEMMNKLIGYYGGFANTEVANMVYAELLYVKPSDLDALFRNILSTVPAGWKPDYKSVTESIRFLKLELLQQPGIETTCKVCGTVQFSNGCCPLCKYEPHTDGSPDEYRKFWNDWKSGKLARFDAGKMLEELGKNKVI